MIKFSFNVSNDFKKPADALKADTSKAPEEEFDFDIHFDQHIDPEHLEGAEDLHDFNIDHSDSQDDEDYSFEDDGDFVDIVLDDSASSFSENKSSSPTEEEDEEDYNFDDEESTEPATDDGEVQEGETEEEETEDYDFDADDGKSLDDDGDEETEEEETEDYDFDADDGEIQDDDGDEETEEEETEDYDFDADDGKSLDEDLHNIDGLSDVKMSSTQSFSQNQVAEEEVDEEEEYDFDEDEEVETEEADDEEEEYDFDDDTTEMDNDMPEEIEIEESDEEYDFDEPITEAKPDKKGGKQGKSRGAEAVPTGSKIAQMINPKNDSPSHKTPKINKKISKPEKTFSRHIDLHRTKISLLAILIIVSALWIYASQVGVTTKSIPTFKDGVIKIHKTQGVQMQYTLREKLIFHESKAEIILNEFTKMEIDGTFSLASNLFSSIHHNLNDVTLKIADAKIKITTTQDINILSTISEFANRDFAKMLKGVAIENTTIEVTNAEGKVVGRLLVKGLEFTNLPQKSTITGTIITNSKPVSINYAYTPKGNLLDATLKSSAFNFNINGTYATFGTATKDSQTKGKVELVVKDCEEFIKIFGGNKTITQSLAHLPQITIQADIDHSSLNHELTIANGKLNVLNSVGTFSLKTTPDNYQALVEFENLSVTEILERILTILNQKSTVKKPDSSQKKPDIKKDLAKKAGDKTDEKKTNEKDEKKTNENKANENKANENKAKGGVNKDHLLNIFSVVNPAKPIIIDVAIKNISGKSENLFHNLTTNIAITRNTLTLSTLQVEAGNNLRIEADGSIDHLKTTPVSMLNVAITGSGNYKNIVSKTVELLTNFQLAKEIKEETSVIKLTTVHKEPSTTINTVEIDIQDTLSLQGSTQSTAHFTEGGTQSTFRNITISNTNLNNLKIDGIVISQGETIFQDVVNNNAQNTSSVLNIMNSKFKDLTITQATIGKETQKDFVSHKIDINTTDFLLQNSTTINIQKSTPEFQSTTVIQNVASFPAFHKVLEGIFDKNSILIPSFEKIDGNIHLILLQTKIFNKPFEKIEIIGNLKQGILEIPETKLISTSGEAKPLSGKVSGTVDLRRSKPVFNLQATFVNAEMEEFKTVLPFKANIGGSIFGGGSIEFSGTTYSDLLNSIKLHTKFVVQDAMISNINLDLVGQHLLKRQKDLESLNPDYIKTMFEQDGKTRANFIFALNGDAKKFAIEDCTIKTAYAGGACYGNVTIGDGNLATVEIIAKFAIPALDINNNLKDIMKLYISSKVKQEGETCNIVNDFSQINKYTSYRKTTFSS